MNFRLRAFFLLLFSTALTLHLYAADDPECADSSLYLPASYQYDTNVSFRKTCLPDSNGNLRKTLNTRGGIYLIGNQIMCKGSNGYCEDPGDTVPNNNITPIYGDHDDNISLGVLSSEANSTFSSTMAKLNLKSGDTIVKAKLFWMGRYTSGTRDYNDVKDVKLLTPDTSGAYVNITCSHYARVSSNAYCSADVTNYIGSSGDVWVGNIAGDLSKNSFSAWALYVVYTNKSDPYQNISVYEGFDDFYGNSLDIPIQGFLTPETGSFDATLHIFSGESDFSFKDYLQISDTAGNPTTIINPVTGLSDDFLNASISTYGVINPDRIPNFNNALGIDIDSVYIVDANNSGILDNNQTATTITFTSIDDQLYIPMVALTTELYKPQLCYDYGYSQNGRSFTEENNGSLAPRLTGDVIAGDPIDLSIYIKNLNDGSVLKNIEFTLKDLNTTQLSYDGNVTQTNPGSLAYYLVDPANITILSNGVYYNLASTIPNGERIFTRMQLDPHVTTIDTPLSMSLSFDIEINATTDIRYTDFTLDKDVPLCSESADYTIPFGVYSILDKHLNQTALNANDSSSLKYNLFTQTTDRNFHTELVAFDPDDLNVTSAVNDFVAVEMINVGHFHDPLSACVDPHTRITSRQWLHFAPPTPSADGNVSHMPFIPDDNSFTHVARENVTFRIWHLIGDDNVSGIFTHAADGTAILKNFDGNNTNGMCAPPDPSSQTYGDTISTHCPAATSLDTAQQKLCAECLFGYTAEGICSRDNFAIRPESFDIAIFDINHSLPDGSLERNNSKSQLLGYDHNLSAGYNYRFEINATTHIDNSASPDYTKLFNESSNDHNASFEWTPKPSHITTGCNDITTQSPTFYMLHGKLFDPQYHQERELSNVGRYTFTMTDNGWTKVDQEPAHHTGSHWLSGADCLLDSDAVPTVSIDANASNMGCVIRSEHTNSDDSSLSTQNHLINFVPNKFLKTTIHAFKDRNNTLVPDNNISLIYMSDLNQSTQMAFRFTGEITPAGENNSSLSNFVDNCYAKDVNISLKFFNPLSNDPKLQYRLQERNITKDIVYDTLAKDVDLTLADLNDTVYITIPASHFLKGGQGLVDSNLSLNFERNASMPKNIERLWLEDYNLSCSEEQECLSDANLTHDFTAKMNLKRDDILIFGYGRVHAPRYRIQGSSQDIRIFYEVYCNEGQRCTDAVLSSGYGLGAESVDDVNWYTNIYHEFELREGEVTDYNRSALVAFDLANKQYNQGVQTFNVTYDTSKGYPFKTKVRMSTQPWLLFNTFVSNVSTSDFMLEFFNANPLWQGEANATEAVDTKSAPTSNRRIQW